MSDDLGIVWHPNSQVIAVVNSVNGVPIRLTEERWLHIVEFHRGLEAFQPEILLTVANPDKLYHSPRGVKPNFGAVKPFDRLSEFGLARNLIVHYKEVSQSDGFILTSFVMSDDRLLKRFMAWQKLK